MIQPNQKTKLLLTSLLIVLSVTLNAQQRYWVVFANKQQTHFNPLEYFHPLAIERRIKNNLPLADSTDFPVNEAYLNQIAPYIQQTGHVSRWLNAVSAHISPSNLKTVAGLGCVKKIVPITQTAKLAGRTTTTESVPDTALLTNQLLSMQAAFLTDSGYTGKGIRIAVFDGGFPQVDTHEAFEHIRLHNRIVKTYDFCKKKEFVYGYNSHGRMVLSNIAGLYQKKQPMGMATDAEFLLARTEVNAEPFSEEENWLAAAEWADKNGAHIINSSLGYTYHRYFNWNMDGQTSLVAQAAKMATQKGMLVVNAMGNDGDMDWKMVGTPADVDSVLSVGGIDPTTRFHINFSSYGPNAKGVRKPNVAAFGETVVAQKKGYSNAFGTSFATPLISGFAACVWQKNPNLNNHAIFQLIEKSANLYPYYDYAHGYGIPQASFFYKNEKTKPKKTFTFKQVADSVVVIVEDKFVPTQQIDTQNYMYYHVADENGKIKKYWLIDVYQKEALTLDTRNWADDDVLRVAYKGYVAEFEL